MTASILRGSAAASWRSVAQLRCSQKLARLLPYTLQLHALHIGTVPHLLLQALLQQQRICCGSQRLFVSEQPVQCTLTLSDPSCGCHVNTGMTEEGIRPQGLQVHMHVESTQWMPNLFVCK